MSKECFTVKNIEPTKKKYYQTQNFIAMLKISWYKQPFKT